jgi:hypothetical protein
VTQISGRLGRRTANFFIVDMVMMMMAGAVAAGVVGTPKSTNI